MKNNAESVPPSCRTVVREGDPMREYTIEPMADGSWRVLSAEHGEMWVLRAGDARFRMMWQRPYAMVMSGPQDWPDLQLMFGL